MFFLKGHTGTDQDGYPTTTLARGSVLERLSRQDFATLDRLLLTLLAEADRDPRREYHVFDALDSFAATPPSIHQSTVNCQTALPHSPTANAARGVNLVANLASRKGTFALTDLPDEPRQQLTNDMARARLALDRALMAAPGLLPAWLRRMELASLVVHTKPWKPSPTRPSKHRRIPAWSACAGSRRWIAATPPPCDHRHHGRARDYQTILHARP